MKTKLIRLHGRSVTDSIYFETISMSKITPEMAKKEQSKLGFPVEGYGFEEFKITESGSGFKATWRCQASCD